MNRNPDQQYENIEQRESQVSEWLKGRFLKERLLFAQVAPLILEAMNRLGGHSKDEDYEKSAFLTLGTRIFNDFEGAKHLLLWGLPDPAAHLIRDTIECTMLFRLFLKEPKRAEKWLLTMTEYKPRAVYEDLKNLNVDAKEYALYGPLSHQTHANLLGSLSPVQEQDARELGTLRQFHFGSSRTPVTESLIQERFVQLFVLSHFCLTGPLAELQRQGSDREVFETWGRRVDILIPDVQDLASEYCKRFPSGKCLDPTILEMVEKRMRFKQAEKRLEGDGNPNG